MDFWVWFYLYYESINIGTFKKNFKNMFIYLRERKGEGEREKH